MDGSEPPNGTLLVMGIVYDNLDAPSPDETRGRTEPKVFTYAALKMAGLWHFTGSGQVPQSAGWGAVERWLGKNGRRVVWVRLVTQTALIWPEIQEPELAPGLDQLALEQ